MIPADTPSETRVRHLGWLLSRRHVAFLAKPALLAVLLVWPLIYQSGYATRVMTTGGLWAILAIGVVIILGQAGQFSFGHAAFFGIGAYTAGLLAVNFSVPTFPALIVGMLAPGLVALIVGRPVLKLRYFYLGLATIGLGQIVIVLVTQLRGITGGAEGLTPIPPLSILGFHFNTDLRQYYLIWVVAIIVIVFVDRALRFRVGRSLRALATSEVASKTLGIRTANWKLLAFVSSAIVCGLAGGLYAFVTRAIAPGAFSFSAALLPFIMMLIGGETVWGTVIGAILMTWVINGFTGAANYTGVIYPSIMILLLIFFPAGILLRPSQRVRLKLLFRRCQSLSRAQREAAAKDGQGAGPSATSLALAPTAAALGVATAPTGPLQTATMATTGEQGHHASADDDDSGAPLLEVEGVSVAFGGLQAVDRVSLKVRQGEIAALIGPNGAGKTTLFNAISRLQNLQEGSIRFVGVDVTKRTASDVARLGMARTFQTVRLYVNMTVLENVLVGCHKHERAGFWACGLGLPYQRREEKASRRQAIRALEIVGLSDKALLPAVSLPYGLQRLVEIARALAAEPTLLLLDEPAAGMNAAERADLIRRIRSIRDSGVTVLMVEHDIELVMDLSERVHVLDYGRLIAEGSPALVQNEPAVIEAYLGAKVEGGRELCRPPASGDGDRPESEAALLVTDLTTAYGSVEALRGVSFAVHRGEVFTVLGANGAGKTTLLHTISGILRSKSGSVVYRGADITHLEAARIVTRGICQVPEGRQLFRDLSVQDNLVVGTSGAADWRRRLSDDLAYIFELFPILKERRKQSAGTLSGGEQQMLAIARALVGRPQLLLLDEPSMGLAPLVTERIFAALAQLSREGLTMLMVEQSASMALSIAHRGIVLQTGQVVLAGSADSLIADDRVRAGYLGSCRSSSTLG